LQGTAELSERGANSEQQALETQEPNGLLIEAVDERALAEARERNVARLRRVWNERRWLFRVAVWGLVLSTAVAFLIPKRYTATARLMPPDQTSTGAGAMLAAVAGRAGSLAGMAESALGLKTTGALFIGILQSDTVQDDLIQKFGLQKEYRARYLEDARKDLASHTAISEDQKSGIITVAVTDHSPERARSMAQEYVNELNWVVSHQTTSSAHRERVFLEQRLAQVKRELEAAENGFSQFASKNGAIDIKEQGKAMVTAAATLQGQLIAAESELEGLRQVYTDNNVRVRATEARVGELKRQLEKLGGKGAGETSGIQSLYPPIRQLPVLGVTYADLYRKVKVEEAVFETLTQEYELAKVEEAKEIPTVKVLDAPAVPQKKSFPPRLLIMALGTMLALVGGVTWVLGQAAWKATDTADPRKALASEVWSDVREALPWVSLNGSGASQPAGWLREKFRRSQAEKAEASEPLGGPEDGEAGESKQEEATKD
jgi:capsule polysaccharide export protein KpsE/RkpR